MGFGARYPWITFSYRKFDEIDSWSSDPCVDPQFIYYISFTKSVMIIMLYCPEDELGCREVRGWGDVPIIRVFTWGIVELDTRAVNECQAVLGKRWGTRPVVLVR